MCGHCFKNIQYAAVVSINASIKLMTDSLFQESYHNRSGSVAHILYWLQAQEVAGKAKKTQGNVAMIEYIIPKALNLYLKIVVGIFAFMAYTNWDTGKKNMEKSAPVKGFKSK